MTAPIVNMIYFDEKKEQKNYNLAHKSVKNNGYNSKSKL